MKNNVKNIVCMFFLLLGITSTRADNVFVTTYNKVVNWVDSTYFKINFNKAYLISGALVAGSLVTAPKYTPHVTGAVTLYGVYAWLEGFITVSNMRYKYSISEWNDREWHDGSGREVFMLARWRQNNHSADGIYWSSAFYMNDDRREVRRYLIQDIHAGRILLRDENGRKIDLPTPGQVLKAINDEIAWLASDKQTMAYYTDLYRRYSQPEEFHPDVTWTKYVYPNYNAASQMYIELDIMMKRLEVLKTIVASIQAETGSGGWPTR